MLKKKKCDYSQSFNTIVDDWALDTKKMQIVSKGKINLQEQLNASRDTAFDRIIDRFLNGQDNLPSPCPPSSSQFGEFADLDSASYLIELEDYLSQYDGELYDADLPFADKKAIFDTKSSEWLKEFAIKQNSKNDVKNDVKNEDSQKEEDKKCEEEN